MNMGKIITNCPELENIPEGSSYLVEAGDGSGTKRVTHETLVSEIEKALPIGDVEELRELEELEVAGNLEDESEDPTPKRKFTLVKAILKVLGVATSVFKGTDGIKDGTAGLVPIPRPEDEGKVLGANGKWVNPLSGGGDIDAENVKFEDEKNAEEKLGAIDGMTSDLNCENERIAASAVGLKKVNDSLATCKLITEGSGADTKYYIQKGADAASKKQLGSAKVTAYDFYYEPEPTILSFEGHTMGKYELYIMSSYRNVEPTITLTDLSIDLYSDRKVNTITSGSNYYVQLYTGNFEVTGNNPQITITNTAGTLCYALIVDNT